MKNFIKVLAFFIMISNLSWTQSEEFNCVTGEEDHTWEGQIGGWILPSEGTVKCLFVFAQFPDDNFNINNQGWPKGQAPANMNGWVDPVWSSNPTQGSMTHYFNEMSFNKLKFVGQTVSVCTPNSRDWYLANNKKRIDIHTEILQQLDATIDFAQFDNWDFEGDYNHINQPDGVVDMIFMVWRNVSSEYPHQQDSTIRANLDLNRYADL